MIEKAKTMMDSTNKSSEPKQIRITYEKQVNGGVEKREIVLTGYRGLVLILLMLLITCISLALSGVKVF